MIGEIEILSLEDDLYESDSIIRSTLGNLERVGSFAGTMIEVASHENRVPSLEKRFVEWFDTASQIDFIVLVERGKVQPLAIRGSAEEQGRLTSRLQKWFTQNPGKMGNSGFMGVEGQTYLAQVVAFGERSDGNLLLIGIGAESSLFPRIENILNAKLALVEVKPQPDNSNRAAEVPPQPKDSAISQEKVFPGLVPGKSYRLSLTLEGGLFESLRTRLVWFPALFLTVLILSALFGAAWATHIVLRPLGILNRTMLKISGPESYGIRAQVESRDEIGELAGVFNHLMERLEEAQTQLKAAQHREVEIGKLKTLKATVVTLAHQINNPLAALLGKCELLLLDQKEPGPQKRSLEVIRDMALRITEVIRKLQSIQAVETTVYLRDQDMVRIEDDEKQVLYALEEQP